MPDEITQVEPIRPLRLALLSTPRTGNAWLRQMLAKALNLTEWAVHTPNDINWAYLPERVILQLHWHRSSQLEEQLSKHHFHVISLTRHPLDILLSILAFAQHDSSTLQWLDGEGGGEQILDGANPLSPAFLKYAVSRRAAALLNVSADWESFPGVCRVRYEDLVENTDAQLRRILRTVEPDREPVEELLSTALAQNTVRQMRSRSVNELFHIWQARCGVWKELLPEAEARAIYNAHAALFTTMGYTCESFTDLQSARAVETWEELEQQRQTQILTGLKRQMGNQESRLGDLHAVNSQIQAESRQQTLRYQAELREHSERAAAMAAELAAFRTRLGEFEDVTPKTLVVTRKLQRFSLLYKLLGFLLTWVRLPERKSSPTTPSTVSFH